MANAMRGPAAWVGLLIGLAAAWPVVLPDPRQISSLFTDDTFYYLEVARHAARGDGFTFDGINPTNGFQPLWQLVLVGLAWLFPADTELLRAVVLLQAGLLAAAGMILCRILEPRAGPVGATTAAVALLGLPGSSLLLLGMEAALFLLILLLAWHAWLLCEEKGDIQVSDAARLGLLCGMLFLARVEGALATPVAAVLAGRMLRRRGRTAVRLVPLLLPPALIAGLYLCWNQCAFGTLLPVSGRVKLHWLSFLPGTRRLLALVDIPWVGRHLLARACGTHLPPPAARLLSGVLVVGVTLVAAARPGAHRGFVAVTGLPFLLWTCGAIVLSDQVALGPFMGEWATVPVHLLTALALAFLAWRVPRMGRAALSILVLACVLRVPVQVRQAVHWQDSFVGRGILMASWMDDRVPPGDRIGAPYAGVIGFFSHRTVVNLDGLVNSPEFYSRVIRGGMWDAWVASQNLRWIVDIGCRGEPPLMGVTSWARQKFALASCYRVNHQVALPDLRPQCGLILWEGDSGRCPALAGGT